MKNEVIVYGAGELGKAAVHILYTKGKVIKKICDKSIYLRNTVLEDIEIVNPSDLDEHDKNECDFLVSIVAVPYDTVKSFLYDLGCKNVFWVGDYVKKLCPDSYITNEWRLSSSKIDFESYAHIWCDEESTINYNEALSWFAGKRKDVFTCVKIDRNKYFPTFIEGILRKNDNYLDTGILKGDFIDYFINKLESDSAVFGCVLSPNPMSYESIIAKYSENKRVEILNFEFGKTNEIIPVKRMGLMDPFTEDKKYAVNMKTIDSSFKEQRFDVLRVYSISSTLDILSGGIEAIKTYRPVIACLISHYEKDFVGVPMLLFNNLTEYNFSFRIHSYNGYDGIMYAIPKERI